MVFLARICNVLNSYVCVNVRQRNSLEDDLLVGAKWRLRTFGNLYIQFSFYRAGGIDVKRDYT